MPTTTLWTRLTLAARRPKPSSIALSAGSGPGARRTHGDRAARQRPASADAMATVQPDRLPPSAWGEAGVARGLGVARPPVLTAARAAAAAAPMGWALQCRWLRHQVARLAGEGDAPHQRLLMLLALGHSEAEVASSVDATLALLALMGPTPAAAAERLARLDADLHGCAHHPRRPLLRTMLRLDDAQRAALQHHVRALGLRHERPMLRLADVPAEQWRELAELASARGIAELDAPGQTNLIDQVSLMICRRALPPA
jgi:hypothetical protein